MLMGISHTIYFAFLTRIIEKYISEILPTIKINASCKITSCKITSAAHIFCLVQEHSLDRVAVCIYSGHAALCPQETSKKMLVLATNNGVESTNTSTTLLQCHYTE